ncbi:oxygenase MpaB family protein [Leifsonia poae]|uniref:oxygenase MpaB family protein n=1 Tax=Leifsonia poae TaxID=110933 RepID=UPI001CBFC3EA|nr:oxygenase MpaB family protein [Leifsonia poae]
MNTPLAGSLTATDVAGEALYLAGGGRALLLQIAHPAIGRGVVEHSDFAHRLMERLHATMTFVYASVYATPEEFAAVRRSVNRAHAPVHAEADGERPSYNAYDPELQLWVAATLYETMMTLYERFFSPLPAADADRIYREFTSLGSALQVPQQNWPADRAAFADYWQETLRTLRPTPDTRKVARQILYPRGVPLWLRGLFPQARLVTAGLLPERLRDDFGLPWNDRTARRFERWMRVAEAVYPRLPTSLRHRPKELYLRRLRRTLRDEKATRAR